MIRFLNRHPVGCLFILVQFAIYGLSTIVGEWTRDRRKFLKCEIRIHVPAGSIAQGEYDIS